MAYQDYKLIQIARQGAIITATINAPPINIITLDLFGELARLAIELEADPSAIVVVFKSADPDFFFAHFDVEALIDIANGPKGPLGDASAFEDMCRRYQTMDTVSIAQIEGRVGGGGSELSMSFDMRFGVIGKTIVNQMEVPIGIIPGGTGTQRMPRLIGRARTLEIILGGIDLDAETAERWGYLNRALPAGKIGAHVDALARRIASFPPQAVRLAKRAVAAAALPLEEGCKIEAELFRTLLFTDEARTKMARFMELGGQTREGERRVADLSGEVAAAEKD
jgi:enoyl-CoA hydratase/carnithine racemase